MKKLLLTFILVAGALLSGERCVGQDSGVGHGTAAAAAAKKQFFVRLIPPRATFADDITTAEMKLMQEHALYWEAQFAKGTVLVLGPVMDPRGVFGMGVVEAASEEEAKELVRNDPSVKAGLNKWELAPMRVFLMKK